MKSRSSHKLLAAVLLLTLISGVVAIPAAAIRFDGLWSYDMAGGDDRETIDEFRQRYTLNLSPTLAKGFKPNHAIYVSGGLNVSYVTRNDGEETRTREEYSPFGNLSLQNDIFIATLTGYQTFARGDSEVFDGNSSWESAIQSAWVEPLWPDFRLSYQETNLSTGDEFLGEPDQVNKNTNLKVTWDFLYGDLYYNLRHNELEDLLSDNVVTNDSHFVRANANVRLFSNRLGLNTTQTLQIDQQSIDFGGTGDQLLRRPGITASAVTDPAFLPDPLPGQNWTDAEVGLVGNPLLRDFDFTTSAVDLPPGERVHLAFTNTSGFTPELQVDFVRVTLGPLTAEADASLLLVWDLYVRDDFFADEWTLLASGIPASYDDPSKQIDIPVNIAEQQFMLVAVNPAAGVTLELTEFEAIRLFSATESPDIEYSTYKSDYGLSYKITESLRASMVFSYDQDDAEIDGRNETTAKDTTYSGRLNWLPTSKSTVAFVYTNNLDEKIRSDDIETQFYSAQFSLRPLSTLSLSFNASRRETYIADEKTEYRNTYSFSTRGQIYPDLRALWSVTYQEGEQYLDDFTNVTENYNTRLELNAQIRKYLFGDLIGNYSVSENRGESSDTGRINLNLAFRPSDRFNVRGTLVSNFADGNNTQDYSANVYLGIIKNPKTTLTLSTRHDYRSDADDPTHSFNVSWDWFISRMLTLRSNGNYRIATSDAWGVNFLLRFSL